MATEQGSSHQGTWLKGPSSRCGRPLHSDERGNLNLGFQRPTIHELFAQSADRGTLKSTRERYQRAKSRHIHLLALG